MNLVRKKNKKGYVKNIKALLTFLFRIHAFINVNFLCDSPDI